ncbi:GRP family sugar transporter [Pediococcus argentinicus]|uniref:Glucose uptake protein n=1 Tax=Pediococcus argentinicus TaxID=480391 RepID=A0A0R2NJY0_9LACO|nr:GRP family sugar transporter [Pediococcus argentinicus]KRO24907.1 glucose uptake protein [Pediococcus argentinicus]NKZ22606.1 ribose uptake protein RbsU [Pediococcus argentinicus]GEP19735.1 putative sugar uptake protein [Pediococcus argentinicus]
MNILIGIIPAIAWGILPLAVTKIGGKTTNQIIGTTFGTFIVSLIVWLIMQPAVTTGQFLLSALSGAAWTIGQFLQYTAFKRIGVSQAMPISTGLQLVGTSLLGILAFDEWSKGNELLIGIIALVVIIIGIVLTTIDGEQSNSKTKNAIGPTIVIFLISTVGYIGYSAFPRMAKVSGLQGFMPQGLGMALMALILVLSTGKRKVFTEKVTWIGLIDGAIFSIAALTYLMSAQLNGIATGFTLSQMNVVIGTIGGILILHEKRSKAGIIWTIAGLVLVVVGGVLIGNMN